MIFITHPDVVIEPDVPVTRWRLSDRGIARMRAFVASPVVERVREVWASTEAKAIEAAGLLAARLGVAVNVHPDLGENDRSATGYLPSREFEIMADAFFARPSESVRGWETASAAQSRITRTVQSLLNNRAATGDVAIVSHGAVGALLMCGMLNRSISRDLDQPFQGHYFSFDPETLTVLHPWTPIAPR